MKRLDLLDVARFLAALTVLFHHYLFNGISNGKITTITHISSLQKVTQYGYLGVELFLMISGYVIFFSSMNRSARSFAVSRAVRLLPCYWFAVILTTVFASFIGGDKMAVGAGQFLTNLTMFAPTFGFQYVDGVYWTLKLEVMFYALVLLFLVFGINDKLNLFFLMWPIVFTITNVGRLDIPYGGTYFAYFCAGALFAMLKNCPSLWKVGALLLCFANCLTYSAGTGIKAVPGVYFSPAVIGTLVGMFFLFFTLLNTDRFSKVSIPGAQLMGGLTYPIYLIHAHIGYMLINKFATDDNKYFVITIIIAFVLLIAMFMHVVIEKKLSKFWTKALQQTMGRVVGDIESYLGRKVSAARKALQS